MERPAFTRRLFRYLILFTIAVNMIVIALFTFYLIKYWPVLKHLHESHFKVKRSINVSIDTVFPVTATIDTNLMIPLNEDLPYSIPVKSTIQVPLDDNLSVPITSPITIELDHTFHIEKDIYVLSELPVDKTVETEIMGVKANVPIRTDIPVELTFPLKEDIDIKEKLTLLASDPVQCNLKKSIDVPIDFNVEGFFPLREEISIPLKADIPSQVTLRGTMPILIELDFIDILLNKNSEIFQE